MGLLYRHGYFKQQIDKGRRAGSRQLESKLSPSADPRGAAKQRARADLGADARARSLAKIWELHVGRINLYLLDTDVAENAPEDRLITAELYGGDLEMRMRQEIVLGIGGVKALSALGISAEVFHMNEGHAAFLAWSGSGC
jgi:starch phosphorylase